jgi:hypothetical protein
VVHTDDPCVLDRMASHLEARVTELRGQALAIRVQRALAARVDAPTAPASTPALLTTTQLAEHLGCSKAHVRRLDGEGLPSIVIGDVTSRRYDVSAVTAWLAARQPKATTPAPKATPANDADEDDVDGLLARATARRRGAR